MSQQYPNQPQQPGQFGAPQPPKKKRTGRNIGLGCLGVVGLFVVIGIIAAVAGGGDDKASDTVGAKPSATTPSKTAEPATPADKPSSDKPKTAPKQDKPKTVTFKVWGTAPVGALGPLDITYGSDSDTRKGKFSAGKFEATLPLNKDAMYFNVMAQLQGSGDIHCSVSVGDKTKEAHASGGYNICNAQLNSGLLGGWE
jgi:hypothetical protein